MTSALQRVARGLRNGTLWNSVRMRLPRRTGAQLERMLRHCRIPCGAGVPLDSTGRFAAAAEAAAGPAGAGLQPREPVRLMAGYTPCGFDVATTSRFAVISTTGRATQPATATHEAGGPARLLHVRGADELRKRSHGWRQRFQQFPGLLDEAGNHDDERLRATVLVQATASGLPVSLRDEGELRRWLPAAIVNQWLETTPEDLLLPARREQIAWRQWSAVHDLLPVEGELLRPAEEGRRRRKSLSVLVATRRPELVEFWAMQIAAQEYADFEVIAALHGPTFSSDDEAVARDWLGDRLSVIRVSREQVLGDVLNQMAAAASGELLVKWDDDDLYDSRHLGDLARAHAYSGAALTGKPADCMYFADDDLTVRVLTGPAERYGSRVAGNTLCLSREALAAAGGWRSLPDTVDTRLIEDVARAGGQVYRSSGFGHLVLRMNHSSHRHIWQLSHNQLHSRCESKVPGLHPEMALVNSPPGLLEYLAGRFQAAGELQVETPSPPAPHVTVRPARLLPQHVAAVDHE